MYKLASDAHLESGGEGIALVTGYCANDAKNHQKNIRFLFVVMYSDSQGRLRRR